MSNGSEDEKKNKRERLKGRRTTDSTRERGRGRNNDWNERETCRKRSERMNEMRITDPHKRVK